MPSSDFALHRTKAQMSTPFLSDDPELCTRVQCVAAEPFTNVICCCFFSPEMGDPLRHKYPQNYKKNKYLAKEKEKEKIPLVKGSAGAH